MRLEQARAYAAGAFLWVIAAFMVAMLILAITIWMLAYLRANA